MWHFRFFFGIKNGNFFISVLTPGIFFRKCVIHPDVRYSNAIGQMRAWCVFCGRGLMRRSVILFSSPLFIFQFQSYRPCGFTSCRANFALAFSFSLSNLYRSSANLQRFLDASRTSKIEKWIYTKAPLK